MHVIQHLAGLGAVPNRVQLDSALFQTEISLITPGGTIRSSFVSVISEANCTQILFCSSEVRNVINADVTM